MLCPVKQSATKEENRKSEIFNNSSRMSKGGGGLIVEFALCLYENRSRWWFRGIYAQTRCRLVSLDLFLLRDRHKNLS